MYGDARYEIEDTSTGGDDTLTGGTGDDDLYGDAPVVAATATAGSDTFVFDTATDFGDDIIHDAGIGGVEDTLQFEGVASIAALDAAGTVVDDGTDVVATITATGASVTIEGIGIAAGVGGIDSFAELDATAEVAVVTIP